MKSNDDRKIVTFEKTGLELSMMTWNVRLYVQATRFSSPASDYGTVKNTERTPSWMGWERMTSRSISIPLPL